MPNLFKNHSSYNKNHKDRNKLNTGLANYYCRSEIHLVCQRASWGKDYKN